VYRNFYIAITHRGDREDFKHGAKNVRPVLAKMNQEYEDSKEFD
jgi:hypothetical protein